MEFDELMAETVKLCDAIQKCCDKINEINAELESMIDEIKYGWHPNDYDYFYIPDSAAKKGYTNGIWYESDTFQEFRKTVGVYKTPEEAEAKAKKLGYI